MAIPMARLFNFYSTLRVSSGYDGGGRLRRARLASRLRYEAQDLAQDCASRPPEENGSELGKQIDQVMDEIEAITTTFDSLLARSKLRVKHDESSYPVRSGYDHAAGAVVIWTSISWSFLLISLTLGRALRPLVSKLVGRGFVVREPGLCLCVDWLFLVLALHGRNDNTNEFNISPDCSAQDK